jgi:dihydroorotase
VSVDLVIRNGTLVTGSGRREADIAIAGGRIASVVERGALRDHAAADELDASGLFVLPGMIDGHVHFREPGLAHKETWLTGSRAAVHGGVTTVLEMPNTQPPTRTATDARAKLDLAAAKSYCDFGIFGLVDPASVDDLGGLVESGLVVGLKVFLAPSTGDIGAPTDEQLRQALGLARAAGLRTAFHAEDALAIRAAGGRRPIEAEVRAIDRAGALLSYAGAAGHILHLSSAEGVDAVRRWRSRGVDITCEVSPHHLLLRTAGEVAVYPPIRGQPHADALMAALADGTIDSLASDHAPHAPAEKAGPQPAAGVPGVETMLPLMLTEVAAGRLTIERLVQAGAEAPARAWGLWPRKGSLEVGAYADLAIVDLSREGVIHGEDLHAKHTLTPFEGWVVHGAVAATIVRGRIVMRERQLFADPGWGRWLGDL